YFAMVEPVVRPLEEALEHPELIEDFHRRGVDCVAAEIAEEVRVLFEDQHAAAGACEKQPGHHAGRPAANDDQVERAVSLWRHDVTPIVIAAKSGIPLRLS